MTYALGRGVEYFDMPSVRKIVRDAKRDNFRFSSIVMGIVNAPAFQSSMVESNTINANIEQPVGTQVAAK
jgi:hypothetical protein